jgi:class I fructose-bisphosphate aldolase
MPVIGWMYPRGPHVDDKNTDTLAYSARIGLELGADFLKMKYNNDPEGFKWVLKCAGRSKVLISDEEKMLEAEFLRKSEEIMKIGVTGIVAGKSVWQHDHPLALSKALRKIVYEKATSQEAEKVFEEELHKR